MSGRALLRRLAAFARRRYRTVFALNALLVAVALGLASRLRFDTDVLNLLPKKDPQVRTFLDTLRDFGTFDNLLVIVRVPEGAVLDPYQTYVDNLGKRLEAVPEIAGVTYRLQSPEELLEDFFPKSLLFLNQPAREKLAARLTDEGIRERVSELRRQLAMPQGMAVKIVARLDPLGIADVFLDQVRLKQGALKLDWASGYLLSGDHRLLLLVAKPRKPAQDVEFTKALIASTERAVSETTAEWTDLAGADQGETPPPAPTVGLGGAYRIALSDASAIEREMVFSMFGSLVGVLLLFYFAFRRPASLLYAIVPLGTGLALAFGFSKLAFGVLSSATSGVTALLIGLGIDFVIVSYARYVEERRRGASIDQALHGLAGSASWAVVIGAGTTACTFFAFCVTDFTGLWQMGLLTGVGILFCMAAVLLLLPAMLAWSEDRHAKRAVEPSLRVHALGADKAMRFSMRNPRAVLLVGLAISVVAATMCPRIGFQDSMQTMRPKGNPGILVQDEISKHYGGGLDSMMLVLSGKTDEEVLALADRAARAARRLVDSGILRGVDAITTLVPPPHQQHESLDWLAAQRAAGALDPARIRSAFNAAASAEGLRPEGFGHGLDLLERALTPPGPITPQDFHGSEETRRLLERYLRQTPSGWKSLVYLYPPPGMWKRSAPTEAFDLARELGPQAALTGPNVMSAALRESVKQDAVVASILGLVLVAVLLWLDYRQLRAMLLSLFPLSVGLLWMFGAMAALGIDMNFMNIFVTTMIIGIGTDYAVYVVHRYRETKELDSPAAESALAETGKGVVLAAMTTMVGFGALSFSHYPGLRSMGFVAGLGAVFTCAVTITLLPAAMVLRRRHHAALREALAAAPEPAQQ